MLPWEHLKQSNPAIPEYPLWLGSVPTPALPCSLAFVPMGLKEPSLCCASLSVERDELVKMAKWWWCYPGSKTRFKSLCHGTNYSRWDSKPPPKFLMCNLGRHQNLTISFGCLRRLLSCISHRKHLQGFKCSYLMGELIIQTLLYKHPQTTLCPHTWFCACAKSSSCTDHSTGS